MDKELLKQYNLENTVKRFNQINEYTFITSPMLSEDGEDDENNDQPPMGNQNQDMNQQNQPQPQGNGDMGQGDMMNNDPNQMNGGQGMDNNIPQPQPMGDNGGDMSDESDLPEPDAEQEGDEVIDVDDLTQSQEAAEVKIDGVDDKLTKMLSILNKFTTALEINDRKIDDLRKEFEERNPSEQEKLNIRSQASYPYSETPKDYWDNKTATNPHYNVMYDNDVSTADEQKKFEITKDDINDINFNDISKTFDINDFLKL